MAQSAVICAACGAKVRSDRSKCLRCGEPLVARQEAPAAAPIEIPWKTISIAAACIALSGFGIMLTRGSTEPVPQGAAAGLMLGAQPLAEAVPANSSRANPASGPSAVDPAAVAVSNLLAGEKAFASGNVDAAIERLQEAVRTNPNDPRILNDLGQALVRAGRAKDAIPYFDKAVSITPDSWTYQFNRARAYSQLQQWQPAISGYRTAAQLFPDDYATQYNLAKALQASGNLQGALTGYEKAIQLAPGQSDFQLSYGLALEAAKRPQDAVEAYKRYLELEPPSPEAEKVKAHLAELQPSTKGTGS